MLTFHVVAFSLIFCMNSSDNGSSYSGLLAPAMATTANRAANKNIFCCIFTHTKLIIGRKYEIIQLVPANMMVNVFLILRKRRRRDNNNKRLGENNAHFNDKW